MAITPVFKSIPKNVLEWSRFFTAARRSDGDIEDAELRDSAAISVIGRAEGTTGTPGDIAATGDNQFLRTRGGTLGFGALVDGDIPATIARDTEVATAITAHEALADPHPTYTTAAELAAGIAAHVALADPHPVYMTSTEVDASIATHSGAADPHTVYPLAAGTETISGSWTFTASDPTIILSAAIPQVRWIEPAAAANNRAWRAYAFTEQFVMDVLNDSGSAGTTFLSVDRTGITVDSVAITAAQVRLGTAVRLNVTTGTTAPGAGGAGALPATPAGYLTINVNGTNRQIPYY